MGESQLSSSDRYWAAVAGCFVTLAALCCLGLSFMLRNDSNIGLVLVVASGLALLLLICASLIKCKCQITENTPLEDPPPPYRPSWRRSFFRRFDCETLPIAGGTPSETIRPAHFTTTPSSALPSPPPLYQATAPQEVKSDVSSAVKSPIGLSELRNAAFFPDMDDPPSYQAALTGKEEAKTKVDAHLPTSVP